MRCSGHFKLEPEQHSCADPRRTPPPPHCQIPIKQPCPQPVQVGLCCRAELLSLCSESGLPFLELSNLAPLHSLIQEAFLYFWNQIWSYSIGLSNASQEKPCWGSIQKGQEYFGLEDTARRCPLQIRRKALTWPCCHPGSAFQPPELWDVNLWCFVYKAASPPSVVFCYSSQVDWGTRIRSDQNAYGRPHCSSRFPGSGAERTERSPAALSFLFRKVFTDKIWRERGQQTSVFWFQKRL